MPKSEATFRAATEAMPLMVRCSPARQKPSLCIACQGFEIIGGQWMTEEIALEELASSFGKKNAVRFCFDPLCHHLQPEAPSKHDDCVDDDGSIVIAQCIAHE